MESEKYNWENRRHTYHKKRVGKKTLIFVSFLIVVAIILFTTFSDKISITGNTVKMPTENNSFFISMETEVPEINLKGYYSEIEIIPRRNSEIILGDKAIYFDKMSNSLVLENFDGKIEFDKNSIKILDGKASKATVNGIPMTGKNGREIKVSIDSESNYLELSIKPDFYLNELNLSSSGKIKLNNDIIELNKDPVIIKNMAGSINIKENKMFFEGLTTGLEIKRTDKTISIVK